MSLQSMASKSLYPRHSCVGPTCVEPNCVWFSNLFRSLVSAAIVGFMLLSVSGCAVEGTDNSYAEHESSSKYSIGGLAVFEKLCSQSGIKFFSATRLSPRLERADCILLVGDTFHPPAKEARDWMEDWLARKAGRSIVYFGRDFSADVYYRTQTLDQASSESAHRAVVELASARAKHDVKLYVELPADVFCRWFEIKATGVQREVSSFAGPWSSAIGPNATWPVRVWLDVPDSDRMPLKPTWTPPPTITTWSGWGKATTPKSRNDRQPKNVIYQSVWSTTDINDDATWETEWSKAPDAQVLLSANDGTPLVTRLTSDRYADSQIVTIANAAPLMNVTIVQPHFMRISQRLIGQLGSIKRIAVLRYDRGGISISELADREDEVAGLSVLTTYPMNIIIVHLAFLGLVVCLALFPILGRAQKLPAEPVSDFGQHAQALGQMLRRTGDLKYATQTVADYVQHVRGEALPAWLQSALNRLFPPAIAQPTATSNEPPDSATDSPVTSDSQPANSSPQ